jgi:hypothetical protein
MDRRWHACMNRRPSASARPSEFCTCSDNPPRRRVSSRAQYGHEREMRAPSRDRWQPAKGNTVPLPHLPGNSFSCTEEGA